MNKSIIYNNNNNLYIYIIERVSHLVTTNCLLTLYYSLIYPYLSYCNIVWASTFPSTLYKILVLQKRFESHIPSAPLFQKLQMLNIFDINIFQIFVFIYNIYSSDGNIPEHFKTYFKIHRSIPTQLVNVQILILNFLLPEVNFQ